MAAKEAGNSWFRYVGNVIFLLFNIAESITDPCIVLLMYHVIERDVMKRDVTAGYDVTMTSGMQNPEKLNRTLWGNVSRTAGNVSDNRTIYNDSSIYDVRGPDVEEVIQRTVAGHVMMYRLLLSLPSVLVSLLVGPLSDRRGRLLPALVSSTGSVLAGVCYTGVSALGEGLGAVPALGVLYMGTGVRGLAGRYAGMSLSLHSQAAGDSHLGDRTGRMAGLLAMGLFGSGVGGLVLGGGLYTPGSYTTVLLTSTLLYCSCVPLVVIACTTSRPTALRHHQGACATCCTVSSSTRMSHLLLPLATIALLRGCRSGHEDILVFWVTCSPVSWDKSLYGLLLAADFSSLGVAALVTSFILTCCHFRDAALVTLGLFWRAASCMTLAFSTRSWAIIGSSLLGAPASVTNAALRADISKKVTAEDFGKTFAIVSCVETISNVVGSVVFTNLYKYTLHSHRKAAYLVEGAMHAAAFLIYYFVEFGIKNCQRDRKYYYKQEGNNDFLLHGSESDPENEEFE